MQEAPMPTARITLSGKPQSHYRPVAIGEESFEIEVTRPTLAQRNRDQELMSLDNGEKGEWVSGRIQAAITGWRGLLLTDDTPLKFSLENLAAVCETYPKVYRQIVALAHDAFRGHEEDGKKN